MSSPISPPLSWLVLERYALGELPAAEMREVAARLQASPEDRRALEHILQDQAALPALPDFVQLPTLPTRPNAPAVSLRPNRLRRMALVAAPVLAAAAALLLMRSTSETLPPARRSLKGGELAVRVVSERGSSDMRFATGERFKVLLTCPPDLSGALEVVIYQGGERFQPLPADPDFPCGNQVPWPSAFSLDGHAPAQVCVAKSQHVRHASAPEELGDEAVCITLSPRGVRTH